MPGRASLPPMDRDESRYMQATTQMLQTHDFVDVRFQDQPRYLQPAGIYWLEAASVSAAGSTEPWAFRIPSLLGATASVLLTAWIGATLFGPGCGFTAGVLLAVSVLLGVEGRIATIDATLLATILTAQAALLRLYVDRDQPGRGAAMLYWAALGIGLMLKGPVILLVSMGTILGLLVSERRASWLRRLHAGWGVPLLLAITLPWLIAIGLRSGGDFFARSVGENFLGKLMHGQQAHGQPPGYYMVLFTASFWPGSLFAVLALPFAWRQRATPGVRFLLAWIIPTALVFELVRTKLPHYALPTFPPLACLAAAAILVPARWPQDRRLIWLMRTYGGIWTLVGFAFAVAGPALLWMLEGKASMAAITAASAAILLIGLTPWLLHRRRPAPAIACAAAASLAIAIDTYAVVAPALQTIWLSPRIEAAVLTHRPCPDSVLASASYSEPSLVFALGKATRLIDAPQAAAFLRDNRRCGLALIGVDEQPAFTASLAASGVTARALTSIRGLNYTTGKRLDLTLYSAE